MRAVDAHGTSDLRRPCGIASLDLATGGGLVAGEVHQVDGPESTGKNYLLYRYFAQQQAIHGDKACLAMACFESFVDKHFAQMCGCKIAMSPYDIEVTNRARALRGEPPLTDEEMEEAMNCTTVGEFHIFRGPSEQVLDGIIEAVKSNIYQLIGVDSWDSMLTAAEEQKDLDEIPQVASPATIQTRWAKKVRDAFCDIFRCPECGYAPIEKYVQNEALMNFWYTCSYCGWKGEDPAVEVNETSLYCVRQVRAKIDMSGRPLKGRPYEAKGAYSLQHLNHIRISLHPGPYLKDKKVKIGKEVSWEISKAKAGAREGAIGSFILYFDPLEVDVQGDMLSQCLKHGIVQTIPGGYFEVPDVDMDRVRGKETMLSLMEREPKLMDALRELLYVKCGLAHVRFK
jgi:predicted RNA-binding Zn-ribbon protein involved in translation (DUF1610 family)